MKFKKGVELHNDKATMDLELIDIMAKAEAAYSTLIGNHRVPFLPQFTITSIVDGRHSQNSLHYREGRGRAFDFRTWKNNTGVQMSEELKKEIAARVRCNTPSYVDVVVEKDHIHVEIDKDE